VLLRFVFVVSGAIATVDNGLYGKFEILAREFELFSVESFGEAQAQIEAIKLDRDSLRPRIPTLISIRTCSASKHAESIRSIYHSQVPSSYTA
jgi:hypothetical protein